jgi:hypothetical protein
LIFRTVEVPAKAGHHRDRVRLKPDTTEIGSG